MTFMKPKLILVLTTLLSLLLTANSSSAREALFDRIEAELAKDKVSQASFEQLESYLLANPRS
ncbi:MAG: hypothetical protein K8F91_20750, partial [Candidatus Obscuribacterales bacterium]|nr:hypothetical protein [Candidatus Obscuribacterales bacterium]